MSTAGRSGTTASSAAAVGVPPGKSLIDQPPPTTHSRSGCAAAIGGDPAQVLVGAAAALEARRASSRGRSCPGGSARRRSRAAPARRSQVDDARGRARAGRRGRRALPTAAMRPPAIATAPAVRRAASTVWTTALAQDQIGLHFADATAGAVARVYRNRREPPACAHTAKRGFRRCSVNDGATCAEQRGVRAHTRPKGIPTMNLKRAAAVAAILLLAAPGVQRRRLDRQRRHRRRHHQRLEARHRCRRRGCGRRDQRPLRGRPDVRALLRERQYNGVDADTPPGDFAIHEDGTAYSADCGHPVHGQTAAPATTGAGTVASPWVVTSGFATRDLGIAQKISHVDGSRALHADLEGHEHAPAPASRSARSGTPTSTSPAATRASARSCPARRAPCRASRSTAPRSAWSS